MDCPKVPLGATEIPLVGLGTWELRGEGCEHSVRMAYDLGYRHFDTAHLYKNHKEVRKGLQGLARDSYYLTSKFMLQDLNDGVEEGLDLALKELGTDYLDLYMLHYPFRKGPMEEALQELERLKRKGKARAFGVSNFTTRHLEDALDWGVVPEANQVEFHPRLYQKELLAYAQTHNIRLISFRTLGKGALLKEPLFQEMGAKYGKSAAQILLKWCVDKEIPVIPKASTEERLKENLSLFDFSLEASDVQILDQQPLEHRYCLRREWADFDYR